MTKKEMLDEMEEAGWSYDTDLDSPYKAVKEDYDEMKKELLAVQKDPGGKRTFR